MTTRIRKKLIEVSIPLEAINVASAKEKSIRHGHPSTLHLWWARRPLAACRAVLFAQLVDDPSSWPDRFPTEEAQDAERRRLHKVIEAMVPWEASNNETILNAARWDIARSVAWGLGEEPPPQSNGAAILDYLQTKAPPVYDPFSGGGSIPLEAQRLGLRAYGSDLNPVAVLIGKALVEIPPKFAGRPPVNPKSRAEAANGQLRAWKGAQGLAEDVRYYGQWMRDEAEKRIGHLYPKATLSGGSMATVIAWLWARTVRSPDPAAKGAMVPLVANFMLSTKEGKKAWVEPVIDPEAQDGWRFEVKTGVPSKEQEERLKQGTKVGRGSNFSCVLTGSSIPAAHVKSEGVARRMGNRLIALVAETEGKRGYLSPTPEHEHAAQNVIVPPDTIDLATSTHPQYMACVGYGLDNFKKFYTDRQLTVLTAFSDLIPLVREMVKEEAHGSGWEDDKTSLADGGLGSDGYADAVATYLAFAISKSSTRSCVLSIWETGMGRLAGALGRQAFPMQLNFAETNPLAGAGGDIAGTAVSVAENLDNLGAWAVGSVLQKAAQDNNYSSEPIVVSTDPPYYDNIPYADLSDFFYPWLKRSLASVWPDLFRRISVPKINELVADVKRHGGRDAAGAFFNKGMSAALTSIRRATTDAEPITIYYAFKQAGIEEEGVLSQGWASFLQSVVDAGLVVDGTWPIRTEATNSLKADLNVLASSVVLVCRKRPDEADMITRADFIRTLKHEMPAAIDAIRKAGVGPVDMQQSVIGPGMGVFSRHAKVLEDDDSAMSVKTALAVINRVWEEIENELDQAFDPETQVALAWYATYGFDARASGELITLTTAKNTSDRALFDSGVFKDMKGKAGLTPREDLPPAWSPASDKTLTTWECVQHTARVLNAADGGGEAAAALVAQMGPKAEEARALAYRLFEIATNKGWAAEALVYNELAQEWSKLEDRAATLDDAGRAPRPNQTTFAFNGSA
jgi:putative DNA methylase